MKSANEIRDLVAQYVVAMEREGCITTQVVREAFLKVERHRFLEGFYRWDDKTYQPCSPEGPNYDALKEIYSLQSLCIKIVPPVWCSHPGLVAEMLEFLKLKKGMRVLEVGGGSGYNAALMLDIVGEQGTVITLEIQPDLVEKAKRRLDAAGYGRVCIYEQDAFYGWAEGAPYDRIVATVGCLDISPCWFEQLSKEGYLLIPLNHASFTPLAQIFADGKGRLLRGAGFAYGQGKLSEPELWSEPKHKKAPPNDSHTQVLPLAFKDNAAWDFELFVGLCDPEVLSRLTFAQAEGRWQVAYEREMEHQIKPLYEEFAALGFPQVKDYKIEFTPRSKRSKPALTRVSSNEWIVERKCFVEKVWI